MGKHINDAIMAKLLSSWQFEMCSVQSAINANHNATDSGNTALDLSQVNVILQTDVKDPSVFRGEGSEKCDIK